MISLTCSTTVKYNNFSVTKPSIVVLITISALFVFLSLCMTSDKYPLEEDAFITFRYIENFLHGNGLVFNKSERVEAISNILWALLLAFLSKLGFPLLPTSAIAGLSFGIFTIWIIWLFSVRYFKRRSYFQFISPVLLATHTTFIMLCTSGLETAFYTFLITIGTISSALEGRKEKVFPYSAIIFSFASMTRPEAPLIYVAILLTMVLKDINHHKRRRSTITSLLTFSFIYSLLIAFRVYYYNDILPNTFYARTSPFPLFRRVFSLFLNFIVDTKSYLIFFPALFLFFRTQPKEILYQIIAVVTASIILLFFSSNHLHFKRYLCPMLPLYFILIQEGIFEISIILQRSANVKYYNYKQFFIILLLSFIVFINFLGHKITLPFTHNIKYNPIIHNLKNFLSDPSAIRKKAHIWCDINDDPPQNFQTLFGDWIRRNLPKNSIIVYDQMGQTPFYAGLSYTFIDTFGLTDRVITEIKYRRVIKIKDLALTLFPKIKGNISQNNVTFSEYILSRDPDFIFILVYSEHLRKLTSTVEFNRKYQKYFPDIPPNLKACYRKISVRN